MGGKNSGRRKGSLNKQVKEVQGVLSKICVGPLCNGNYAPVGNFGQNKSYCLPCQKTKETKKREDDYVSYKIREINKHTRNRMKKGKFYEVTPNLKDVLERLLQNQKECFYSGIRLTEKVNDINGWSPDRKDFNDGYVEDNIVLATTLVNKLKGSIEYNFQQLIEAYGEEIALKTLKNIIITVASNRKELAN